MATAISNPATISSSVRSWLFPISGWPIKLLTLVNLAGPILGNSPNEGSTVENAHWYVNRPAETLAQLYELINRVKHHLESGFRRPAGTRAKVYKAKQDGSADPVSALLINKGMRKSNGDHTEVERADTRKHVFTRLSGRSPPSEADFRLRDDTFLEMTGKMQSTP
jgi:carboxylesterase